MNKIYLGGTEVANVGSGGGGDMTNYYDKSHIDASFNYVDEAIEDIGDDLDHLNSSKVESSSVYLKEHIDASYGIIDASLKSFDASIKAFASSGGGGGDMSNYATKDDISTFKSIVYTNLSTYEEDVSEGTIDENAMYVITDLASSDDLASLVTIDDLAPFKQDILDNLSTTADQAIANASTSINSIKTTAISAVQSQQTTSVNAVNTAKNNANTSIGNAKTSAISDISTFAAEKMASMPAIVVMTESEYNQITPNSSTLYFLT